MLSLDERFALLQADLLADPPSFIMARELPFAIFRYDPNTPEESEWLVRRKIQLLATQIQNQTQQPVVTLSLADLFWRSIQESEDIENLYKLEQEHSFSVAERQVHQYLSDPDFRPLCDLLREEEKRLLDMVSVISSVSGGSFTSAYYGLHGDRVFEDFEERFLRRDVEGARHHRVDLALPEQIGADRERRRARGARGGHSDDRPGGPQPAGQTPGGPVVERIPEPAPTEISGQRLLAFLDAPERRADHHPHARWREWKRAQARLGEGQKFEALVTHEF